MMPLLCLMRCVVCAASAGGDPRRCGQSRDDRRRGSGKQAGGPRDGHQRAEEIPQDQGQIAGNPSLPSSYDTL